MTRSLLVPKFRRLRCVVCGRVVPWRWLVEEPKRAVLSIGTDGKPTVCCKDGHHLTMPYTDDD